MVLKLDETWGKRSFYAWVIGFYVAFMPLYVIGLNGFMRRTQHYADVAFQPYLIVAAIGGAIILVGIVMQLIQVYVSIRDRKKLHDRTGDPWNGRTLEWSISSPAPFYNFAKIPVVHSLDAYWDQKERRQFEKYVHPQDMDYQPIHMPKNTAAGFIIAMFTGLAGFALVWHMLIPAIIGIAGAIATMIIRTFSTDIDYYVDVDTIRKLEIAHAKELAS